MQSESTEDLLDDNLTTPTSDVQHLIAPEISTHKAAAQKGKLSDDPAVETNPFRALSRDMEESAEQLVEEHKFSRSPRNPFDWSTKRSGKVLDDSDDPAEFLMADEKSPAASMSSPAHSHGTSRPPAQSQIGQWTAGVVGGGSSKLQAIQKWFKSDSLDGKESPRKRAEGNLTDLASVSVRDLVKAIGCSPHEGRGNGNLPANRSSSPISISTGKFKTFLP